MDYINFTLNRHLHLSPAVWKYRTLESGTPTGFVSVF
uniref:Uncharacterized protein n=1 Tax=Anguilla anguilla TaxID=7936 RepID=A0A0E9XMZ9_ANGAN